MCGIVGYIGNKSAYPIIVNGLKRLEYRGYDSAGIVLQSDLGFQVTKTKGKVADLEQKAQQNNSQKTGIGHTRWATHGEPSDRNSHPHLSNNEQISIVHNGIIENYDVIKTKLTKEGFVFHSDTDTEVLVNLIQYFQDLNACPIEDAVRFALNEAIGAYAIAVMDVKVQNQIVVARLGSPLAIGIGDGELFIASDASPFIEFTKEAVYLDDGEMAILQKDKNNVDIRKIVDNEKVNFAVQELKMDLEQIEKGGYDNFMLKEIFEQPNSIYDTMRGRLLVKEGIIRMAGFWDHQEKFLNANRIIIIACGTSWHAGLVGEYLIEELARISVEVEYASEFRYRNPILNPGDVVIAISQSGETADTLAALKLAKEKGAFIYGICNVVGSSISRITDAGSYTHAGPEIGVASTKAFTAQLTILSLIALNLGIQKGTLSRPRYHALCAELETMPSKVKKALETNDKVIEIAKIFKDSENFLYLGRGYNFPSALEGALKLKEISYIHAEGYPAAEMKHGPIALIDENMPVVTIATKMGHYDKTVSNIEEIKSRKGKLISIVTEGDIRVKAISDYTIEVPDSSEEFSPILVAVPLQLLAYHIAILRGANVDQPRNLAKSVTVE